MCNQAAPPPSDYMHLKGLGPRLSSLDGDGSIPTLQQMRGGEVGVASFRVSNLTVSTVKRTRFQHNLTIISTGFFFCRRVESKRTSAGGSLRWSCWHDDGESLQHRVSAVRLLFSVLHYKMCIHVASVSFFFFLTMQSYIFEILRSSLFKRKKNHVF